MADNLGVNEGSGKQVSTAEAVIDAITVHLQRTRPLGAGDWTPFGGVSITGGSGAANQIIAARIKRRRAVLVNVGSVPVRVGKAASAAAATSVALDPGVMGVFEHSAAIYGYVDSGTGTIEGWEEHD
jgi:hypothetical protein